MLTLPGTVPTLKLTRAAMDDEELVQKPARVYTSDALWFEENYGARGSWSWFIRMCLREFRRQHNQTPLDITREATRRLHRTITFHEDD